MKFAYTPFIVSIAFAFLCSLSLWQVFRGVEKQRLLVTEHAQIQQPLLNNTDFIAIEKNPRWYAYRPIQLTGYFLPHHDILLDNKIHKGQVGYEVITPFVISPTQSVLINRGWISRGPSRQQLPFIEAITSATPLINIKGHITLPSKNRFVKNTFESTTFPFRIQAIDLNRLRPVLNARLAPFVIQLAGDSLWSFEPLPQTAIWLNPQKHFAYALQWLLLAFSLAIIYTRVYYQKPSPL